MAQKRMFDKTITNADDFLEMPDSSQNLYFHLSMNADDDGFVNNWKSILRMTGHKEDDLKILIAKQFIIPFESGVIVIKHWRINNYLRSDRYVETKFKAEKQQLFIDDNLVYQLDTNGVHSIDKNSIDKISIDKNNKEEINKEESNDLFTFVESNFKRTLNPIEYEEISKWEDNELTRYAIRQAILNNAYSLKYIKSILKNYEAKNITTVQQAQEDENSFKERKEKQQREKGLTAREKRDLEFEELLKKYESEGKE